MSPTNLFGARKPVNKRRGSSSSEPHGGTSGKRLHFDNNSDNYDSKNTVMSSVVDSSNSIEVAKKRGSKSGLEDVSRGPVEDSASETEMVIDSNEQKHMSDTDHTVVDATGTKEKIFNGVPMVESAEWQRTTERVVKSVVSIQSATVCSFDTEEASVSEATGFVVDAEEGIIMTNRHVVGAGPFSGYAVFYNHEECDIRPLYRDPVHDFGFLKFDPKKIKHMKVQALELRPELAKIGCEIRVVGNDAGEKLSILAGFISRLDRNAPDYGGMTYNDFNTEYIQAAASTSGGSSGSPVVNIDGNVVGLQAGGNTRAATDFFLPLYRSKRALDAIRSGKKVDRGTIQVQWLLKPYDECSRLGLSEQAEEKHRAQFPESIGLLVAEVVLPEGPSYKLIEEGDCLISINGEPIGSFIRVDDIFDSSIGKEVELVIQRGGQYITCKIKVGDLHAITPDRYVNLAGTIFHNMSYQIARFYSLPVRGVYVADSSNLFRISINDYAGWIIDEVDSQPTPDLDTFVEIIKNIPDSTRVPIKYHHVTDVHSANYTIIPISRHWNTSFCMAIRNDKTGLWDFNDLGKALPPEKIEPQDAKFIELKMEEARVSKLVYSFVKVSTVSPMRIEGILLPPWTSYGLVVDAEKGYVLVSRMVVPHDLCDIYITVADSVIIPARVVFLHPIQNYTIVAYDPKLVRAPIQSAEFSDIPLKQGEQVTFVGHNHNLRMVNTKTRVTDISTVTIPLGADLSPRYRSVNVDAVELDTPLTSDCMSGVMADSDGTVRGLWLVYLGNADSKGDLEYRFGVDAVSIKTVIDQLKRGEKPNPRFLDIEVNANSVVQARILGVGNEWIKKVEESNNERHDLFSIGRVSSGTSEYLREGDIILAIDGKVVTRVSELDVLYDTKELAVTVVRSKKEMTVTVPTVSTDDLTTNWVVSWCGTTIHKPHHAVLQQLKKPPSEVYVVSCASGSPANQYGIASTYFITHVNSTPTPTLDKFWNIISDIADNSYVKLRIVTFDNVACACSIKTNYHYFPTSQLVRDPLTGKWN